MLVKKVIIVAQMTMSMLQSKPKWQYSLKVSFTLADFPCEFAGTYLVLLMLLLRNQAANSYRKSASANEPIGPFIRVDSVSEFADTCLVYKNKIILASIPHEK